MKGQPMEQGEIFASHISGKGLTSKYARDSHNSSAHTHKKLKPKKKN